MRRIRRHRSNKKALIFVFLLLFVMVGYAILTTTLNINGTTKLNKATWNVYWTNVQVSSGSVIPDTQNGELPAAIRDANSQTVNYAITLTKPGDFYEFTVDAKNEGSLDVMIGSISSKLNGTEIVTLPNYLKYEVSYVDGSPVAVNQKLESNHTETYLVRIEYKKDILEADLPTLADVSINLSFSISYIQTDQYATEIVHSNNKCNLNRGQNVGANTICKRAEVLHQETCNQSDTTYYCSAAGYTKEGTHQSKTITYGTCGTSGTLTPGDAFDCDVNGNGQFDPVTERFYYVSGLDGNSNSDYAVFLYYTNVKNGVANTTQTLAYNTEDDAWGYGPKNLISHLPLATTWKGVSLTNPIRNIRDNNGTTRLANFSYEGYSSRFITYQELIAAQCSTTLGATSVGYLDGKCEFMLENTKFATPANAYGYWQESVVSSSSAYSWRVAGGNRYLNYITAGFASYYGARPAIEVLKSRVSY